jgi:archaellin
MAVTDQLVHGNTDHVLSDNDGTMESQYKMLNTGDVVLCNLFCARGVRNSVGTNPEME